MTKSLKVDLVCRILAEEGLLTETQIRKIQKRVAEEREKIIQIKKRELSRHQIREGYSREVPVVGIIAQRLVRRICPYCNKTYHLSVEEQAVLELNIPPEARDNIMIGEGCEKCRWTGYFGRAGIFEVMEINDNIRRLISHRAGNRQIKEQALQNGMVTLHEGAIRKMLNGETTVTEVLRVTGGGENSP